VRDRFVLAGVLALVLALGSSVWLIGSRSSPVSVQAAEPVVDISTPTADPHVAHPTVAGSMGALVVALDGMGGAGAFARTGDYVDVLAFIPAELNEGYATTRMLLADVQVLQGSGDSVLTLAVSPEQALFVRSAQGLGVRMFAALLPSDASIAPHPPEVVTERDLRARLLAGS